MKKLINTLKRIENEAMELNVKMNNEAKIYREELADRKKLGLEGDAAIKHYNEWMIANGMEYLCV